MLLQTEHISKAFNGIYALRDVDFGLEAGEIHGLVGENGAGKSTLIKLLTGVYQLKEGCLLWDGAPVSITSPEDSRLISSRMRMSSGPTPFMGEITPCSTWYRPL